MKTNNRLMKHATGLAAALIAVALAWAPVPALAEIGEIAGVDDWTSIVQGDEADDSGLDVLAVTGTEGDRVWVDVTLNGNLVAEKLMYELVPSAEDSDAEGNFVGIMSLDISDFDPSISFPTAIPAP